jgi:hypothetical protein
MSFMSIRFPAAAVSAAIVTLAIAPLAAAQTPPIRPGLWEIRSEGANDGQRRAQAAERLKNMPPDVRAKIEAMMREKGIAMQAGGVTRLCFAKESMDIGNWQRESSCKTNFSTRSSSSWKWHTVCAEGAAETDGEAVFANPENYMINTSTTLKMGGETKASQRTMKAKWISGNCGDLKPFDPKR